jgi:transglutaminase-like putative cysteine protease
MLFFSPPRALGWVGVDPTNDCPVTEHFIKVAVGRDFTDVPPNKGGLPRPRSGGNPCARGNP